MKNILKYFLIPVVLLFFWIISSLVFNNELSFSVISSYHAEKDIKVPVGKILKGNKVTGEFRARENYLGVVFLKFEDYVKPDYASEDVLIFKIKEKGASSWYYEKDYRSGSFEYLKYYPFGFYPINNSKGKTYDFILESTKGNPLNALGTDKNSNLITGYQFPKQEITSSKGSLASFLLLKTYYSFTNPVFVLSSLIYFLPLLIYLLILLIRMKDPLFKKYFPYLALILIFIDIFFFKDFYDGLLYSLLLLWIASIIIKRLESSVTFVLNFALILIWVFLAFFQIKCFQDKLNIYVYSLLALGFIELFLEERFTFKDMVSYKQFFFKK